MRKLPLLLLCLALTSVAAPPAAFQRQGDTVIVSTARLSATFSQGRIIHLVNRSNGEIFADQKLAEPSYTAGLGRMTNKVAELSRIHFPWGETLLNQHLEHRATAIYHTPSQQSRLELQESPDGIIITWTGLANTEGFFPDESLRLTVGQDELGAMTITAYAKADDGVFGVQVPIENIVNTGTFVLPTFGGLEYPGKGRQALMTFKDSTLFYEAPLMTFELNGSSLALWKEDVRMRPFFAFFTRQANSCAFALESINLIPYENLTEIQAPTLKLDIFPGGDWLAAARPYRNWYHRTFADDIAKRDSIDWANRINVISDGGDRSDEALAKIASLMPKEQVLLHTWQARKEGFTTNIPDYTPKDNYPAEVDRVHRHGFKMMAYTCTICAVYQSPAWIRDNVGDFFLTRKNCITRYNGGKENISENLVGTVNFTTGQDQFKDMKPKQFLYGDPLSKGWRDYYCRIIKEFNAVTGTDANYQDTSGCSGDTGNGIVDGLAGAQAFSAMIRDLQKTMPETPMASEFGPQAIGFGVKWPLNYAQVWGGEAYRRSRIHRHRPLTPFLFGYLTWIPIINANDDFHKHVISASSDALSGMGMFNSSVLDAKAGFDGHLLLRSQVFAQNRLIPYYPDTRYPPQVRAMYQDDKGRVFSYVDDGNLQMMLDPDGKPLYGRVDGVTHITQRDLYLPGWPIQSNGNIYNLDPKKSYALFPKSGDISFPVTIPPLPPEVALSRYYTTGQFAYIELQTPDNKETEATFQLQPGYRKAFLNDQEIPLTSPLRVKAAAPLRLFLTNGEDTPFNTIRKISPDDGLQHGVDEPLPAMKRSMAGRTFYFVNYYQNKSLDSVLTVSDPNSVLELCLINTQAQYGNGSIVRLLINGREIRSFDCIVPNPEATPDRKDVPKKIFDQQLRQWLVPLRDFAGKQILVTVQVDNKAENNADSQWITIPKLITMPLTDVQENFLDPKDNTPEPFVRPQGALLRENTPEWTDPQFSLADGIYTYTPATRHGLAVHPERMPIDRTQRFVLSGEFKAPDDQPVNFFLGVVQYDEKGREINGLQINRQNDTRTALSHPAAAGSDRVMVMNASNWSPGHSLAFRPAADNSDLPRYDLTPPIRELKQHGGDWSAYLEAPLKEDIPADTPVCLHAPTSTHSYVCSTRAPKRFVRFGNTITWWPQAKTFRLLVLSQKPLQFRDLKLEVIAAATE